MFCWYISKTNHQPDRTVGLSDVRRGCGLQVRLLGPRREGPLLYKGVPAVLKATAQLSQEPRRWNDDPKQALTCTITAPELVQWFLDLETWLAPQLKGEFRSVVKPRLFGE